jgi:VIT1/CCC1 family predicted Fe2+/Mn2+ transporter
MRHHRRHREPHRSGALGWLRAAVLGSNDAIVSVASLLVGVGETAASKQTMIVTGVAGLVAGAMSMAVGEYVSVSSQRDAERADIAKESAELEEAPDAELHELAGIYVRRGLERELAMQVARQLSAHDRLGAHLRDELGIVETARARPLQAAWVSAASFSTFALVPIAALALAPAAWRVPVVAIVTLIALGALGALGGWLGGASSGRAAARVVGGGALAMAITSGIGRLLGVAL